MWKMSIQCRDSNSQPSDYESQPLTTRPGLPPNKLYYVRLKLVKGLMQLNEWDKSVQKWLNLIVKENVCLKSWTCRGNMFQLFFYIFSLTPSLSLSLSLTLSHSDAYPTHHPSLSLPLSLTLPASTNLIPDLIKYVKNPLPPSAKKFVSKNQLFKFPPPSCLSLSFTYTR